MLCSPYPTNCRHRHGVLPDSHKPRVFLSTDTLTCQMGSMVRLGSDLTRNEVEWVELRTVESSGVEICQEIFLLIDVGACSELEAHTSTLGQVQPCLGLYSLKNSQLPSSLGSIVSVSCILSCDRVYKEDLG